MAGYKYSLKEIGENSAKAVGINLGISTKVAIEICNHIRGRKVSVSKKILNEAIELKTAIPFTRFTDGVGHRRGKIGAGRYSPTASKAILEIIESAEANAQYKGFNTTNLVIKHLSAQKGAGQWRYGRKRRQKMKQTHIEVVVEERASEEKVADKKKVAKKAETKTAKPVAEKKVEAKPEVKKEKPAVEEKSPEVKKAPVETKKSQSEKPAKETKKAEVKKAKKEESPKVDKKVSEGNDQK